MGVTKEPEYVWIPDERVYGILVSSGAYFSTVAYSVDGITYQVVMSNDEFEYFGDYGIDYYDEN